MAYTYASDEEIKEACGKYRLTDDMKEHLQLFLDARAVFHADETTDNLVEMKHFYEIVYTDLKLAYHMGIMREYDFKNLTNLIKSY